MIQATHCSNYCKSAPNYSSMHQDYPVGQYCVGAQSPAPWAGDYWEMVANGLQDALAAGFRTGSYHSGTVLHGMMGDTVT